jgi:hypothetical protein
MISQNGTFYAGIQFDPTNGDTIAVITNTQNVSPNTAWELWSNNVWYPYDNVNSWNAPLSHLMVPVLCTPVTTSDFGYPSNGFDVELFPNPANNILYIGIGNDVIMNETIELNVLNMLGQVVKSKKLVANSSTINLDIADIEDGLYLIEINQKNKRSIKKFQINH